MNDNSDDILAVYHSVIYYCRIYNIPEENLIDILEDQKVLPMIRGKATEYIGAAFLKRILPAQEWDVQKLNLNPQQGTIDEDVSITFRRTGDRLKAETKNAVRGGFKMKTRTTQEPHFHVKCHKSRSHLRLQATSNDRYKVGEFDLLICNPSNSLFKSKSLEPGLPLIEDKETLGWLKEFYKAKTDDDLRIAAYNDWRFCLPSTIADKDGVIPRTPAVLMTNDNNWFKDNLLPANLLTLINRQS